MSKNFVLSTYPRVRLVTDQTETTFFGIWNGNEYIGISYDSEEDAWNKAAHKIYVMMVKKLES